MFAPAVHSFLKINYNSLVFNHLCLPLPVLPRTLMTVEMFPCDCMKSPVKNLKCFLSCDAFNSESQTLEIFMVCRT